MADAENKLRKRGWSVHSEQDSISVDQPGNGRARLGSEAHSVATADRSLSEAEKQELLASYPTDIIATDSVVVVTETQTKTTEDDVIKVSKDENNGEFSTEDAGDGNEKEGDSDSDGYVAMFGEDNKDDEEEGAIPNDDNPVARKRRKVGDEKLDSTTFVRTEESKKTESEADSTVPGDDTTVVKTVAFNHAKSRLSKWAARLFDPNRPRGLVEPPQVIPLNDEFLTAFGKREKEFDDTIGRDAEIDRSNIDEVDPGGKSSEDAIELDEEEGKKKGAESYEGCKVKITNIGYTTSLELLTKKVQRYGSLVEVNLIMDKDKPNLNIGKAYVTFELAECASDFVDKMNEQTLDGRAIRVAIAASNQRRKSTSGKLGNMMARYWEKDISSKCYRCGEVGHVEAHCTNEEKPKPCPLCAELGHDSWSCPRKNVCFNCGVPGHVSRDCWERRGLPKRTVCGFCFQSGHHRWNCMEQPRNVLAYNATHAKCIVCGELGHFSCQPMRWFFGLKNRYCFNCGQTGHHGINCERPTLDVCSKNSEVALKEIERAEAFSLSEELANQQQMRRGRQQRDVSFGSSNSQGSMERGRKRNSNDRGNGQTERPRARSQPPPGGFRGQYDSRSVVEPAYGYNQSPPYTERRRGYTDSNRSGGGGRSGRGSQRVSNRDRSREGRPPTRNQRRGYN